MRPIRKSSRILLGAIVIALTILAVPQAAAQFRYGPTVGANHTSLKFNQDLLTPEAAYGYQAGIQCEMMFPGIGFGIDFGLQYTQRGSTLNLGDFTVWATEGNKNGRTYMHYIDIPIDIRFKWTRMNGFEDYLAPYVFGGPIISFLAADNNVEALEYPLGTIALQCGLGFQIKGHWQIQASHQWGMTYAVRTRLLDDYSARTRTWTLQLTYLF